MEFKLNPVNNASILIYPTIIKIINTSNSKRINNELNDEPFIMLDLLVSFKFSVLRVGKGGMRESNKVDEKMKKIALNAIEKEVPYREFYKKMEQFDWRKEFITNFYKTAILPAFKHISGKVLAKKINKYLSYVDSSSRYFSSFSSSLIDRYFYIYENFKEFSLLKNINKFPIWEFVMRNMVIGDVLFSTYDNQIVNGLFYYGEEDFIDSKEFILFETYGGDRFWVKKRSEIELYETYNSPFYSTKVYYDEELRENIVYWYMRYAFRRYGAYLTIDKLQNLVKMITEDKFNFETSMTKKGFIPVVINIYDRKYVSGIGFLVGKYISQASLFSDILLVWRDGSAPIDKKVLNFYTAMEYFSNFEKTKYLI